MDRPQLRGYQQLDKEILKQNPTMLCLNEQRTGKTPTVLCAAHEAGAQRILIIAPTSMLPVWAAEFRRWLNRPCEVYHGRPAQRQKAIDNWTDGLVISYTLFKHIDGREGAIDQLLKLKPDAVIVDEAHRAKGRKTANFKAMKRLRHIPRRHFLTGTPAPNHPAEIWALLHFSNPKAFSSYWNFINEYFDSEEVYINTHGRGGARNTTVKPTSLRADKQQEYGQLLEKHSIMRKRKDVMPWLPPTPEPERIRLPLAKSQQTHLKNLEKYFQTGHVMTQGVLDRIVRLRQICNDPQLLGLKGVSPKLEWLKDYTTDYPTTPTIVFSRFTQFLQRIKEKVEHGYYRVGIIVGDTPIAERAELVRKFQTGALEMLLIQVDAGKEGLTLDKAECLIFTDMFPPGGDILQAQDRMVATDPSRADVPKRIIELAMADSFDDELFDATRHGITLAEVTNNYIKYSRGGR